MSMIQKSFIQVSGVLVYFIGRFFFFTSEKDGKGWGRGERFLGAWHGMYGMHTCMERRRRRRRRRKGR
jgi:hypothetical protein